MSDWKERIGSVAMRAIYCVHQKQYVRAIALQKAAIEVAKNEAKKLAAQGDIRAALDAAGAVSYLGAQLGFIELLESYHRKKAHHDIV